MAGLSLLAALFGGAFWGAKYSSDKHAQAKARTNYDAVHQSDEERRKAWEDAVINWQLEIELEDRLHNRDAELLSELESTWKDYFADGEFCDVYGTTRPEYNPCGYRFVNSGEDGKISSLNALRMLMANRGFLLKEDATIGIDFQSVGETASQEKECAQALKHFVRAIDKKLQERGICEEMYVRLHSSADYRSFDRMYGGRVEWRPMISTFALQASGYEIDA